MKSVELLDCDIIQDLLPSYNDKISSDSTNKLVARHLKQCKNCIDVFNSMNKDIGTKVLKNQDEQIDFLKGFKKDKIKTAIKAVLIVIIIFLAYFDAVYYIGKIDLYVDVNDILFEYDTRQSKNDNLVFSVSYENFVLYFKEEYIKDNAIYIKLIKNIDLSDLNYKYRTVYGVEISENIEHLYLEDMYGNLREIWNREQGALVRQF